MGRGDLGVAKPGLDRQEIHARAEELHGERMPEDVRGYCLALQARRDGHGLGRRTPHDVCRAEARQARVVAPDEDWLRLMMAEAAFARSLSRPVSDRTRS